MLELLAVAVPMPPAPPVPVAVLVLVPLIPPAPPAPLVLELEPLLDDALLLVLVLVLDPLLDAELVLAPPSGMYGGGNEPASVTLQIFGGSQRPPVHWALQQSASVEQAIPAMPQRLKVCAPAMQIPMVEGSVRSTIVALNAFGSWQR